ncbi:MAG TPA: DUF4846 domain-containing protein [candidate division Zixibacteria bacterium]|jgi:hypothetical protein
MSRIVSSLLISVAHLTMTAPVAAETIEDRFAAPEGFGRVAVSDHSFQQRLRSLRLLPDTSPALDWQGNVVFSPAEIGGALEWTLLGSMEQCADIAIRLVADYQMAQGDDISVRSLSGDVIGWNDWLHGRYELNADASSLSYRAASERPATADEYASYLRFVMTYANTASLARDWPTVPDSDLQIGDVLIQPYCSGVGMGHLSVIVDACEDRDGDRRYIFIDGYTPARVPIVRQRTSDTAISVWMTAEAYLQLQSRFGPGEFCRPPVN